MIVIVAVISAIAYLFAVAKQQEIASVHKQQS